MPNFNTPSEHASLTSTSSATLLDLPFSSLPYNSLPYNSFQQAALTLFELEAIDYFLAKELVTSLDKTHQQSTGQQFTRVEQRFYFHLFVLLNQSLRDGHTCLFIDSLAHHSVGEHSDDQGYKIHQGYNFPSLQEISQYLSLIDISFSAEQLVVLHNNKLYLRRYFQFEQELSLSLSNKLMMQKKVDNALIQQCIAHLFKPDDVSETIDWQKVGVANALNKGFSVIAGGPGTGKTYTVTKLLAGLVWLHQQKHDDQPSLNIMLSAPTGKAAQRLTESIIQAINGFRGIITDEVLNALPIEAKTLHRTLGVIPHSPNFRHHQDNPMNVDVLLIDEVSMVDLPMMARVFRALPATATVILLGDAEQLPSVEVGSVLADIAPRPHSGYSASNIEYLQQVTSCNALAQHQVKKSQAALDHVTFLTQSRRFDGKGLIGRLASFVIAGDGDNSWALMAKPGEALVAQNSGFTLQSVAPLNDWLPALVKHYYQPLFTFTEVKQAFAQLTQFRILAATRKGEAGVEFINEQVKQLFVKQGIIPSNAGIYHAQPIMIAENDYRLGLYNGDVGFIWRHASGHLMAVFEQTGDDYLWVIPSRLPKFETVYAMTIHKTQGSEFNHVAMILPKQKDNKLLSRELLYTGITRAKSILSLFCFEHVWKSGVENQVKRASGLSLTEQQIKL